MTTALAALPPWLLALDAAIAGFVLGVLIWVPIRARDEARHAEQRRPDPGLWLYDKAGYWWVPVDGLDGYVPVRSADGLRRTTLGPKDPPQLVSREEVDRAVGVDAVVDPTQLPERANS